MRLKVFSERKMDSVRLTDQTNANRCLPVTRALQATADSAKAWEPLGQSSMAGLLLTLTMRSSGPKSGGLE